MVEEKVGEFIKGYLKSQKNLPRDGKELKEFVSEKLLEILQTSKNEELHHNYESIFNGTFEILKEKNLETLNHHIKQICDDNFKDMCLDINKINSLEKVLKIIDFYNEKVTKNISEIIFQQSEMYENPVFSIETHMQNFRSKIIRKLGSSAFSFLNDIENSIIHELSANIEVKLSNFANITTKERDDDLLEILTIGKKRFSDSVLEISPLFPIFLLESYLEDQNEKLLKTWHNQQENHTNDLKIFFESEIESLIERIRQAKITLFDHSEFSPEIRYAITAIINLTSPYSPLVTLSQISYFKQFLGVSLNKSVNDLSLVD